MLKEFAGRPVWEFTHVPDGPITPNEVLNQMHVATRIGGVTFYDRIGQTVEIPRRQAGRSLVPYFDDGYSKMLWDFINGNLLLAEDDVTLYARDVDRSGQNQLLNTWHPIGSIEAEYHVTKTKIYPPWNLQMRVECAKLPTRIRHGVKFNNRAYLRRNERVTVITESDPQFADPFDLTVDMDYDVQLARQAVEHLRFITKEEDSAQNLGRMFATPMLEPYKHLSYILYGDGGNGKGIILGSLKQSFNDFAASVDATKLFGGKNASGGFETGQESIKLLNAIWAFDEDADTIDVAQMTILKKISTGDTVTSRRIQENQVSFNPRCTFILATNNQVISEQSAASDRRLVLVRMKDGRKPVEFADLLAFRAQYGAAPFLMASCEIWLRNGDEPNRDISIGRASDLSPAQQWIVDNIVEQGYAVSGDNPYRENAREHKNTINKLGLRTTTKRIPGGGRMYKPRVLVVNNEKRFAPYRAAAEADLAAADAELIQPRPEPIDDVDVLPSDLGFTCDYAPADENKVARNWKKLSADPAQDTSRPPQVPVHGVVPSPGFMIIDMDMGVDGVADGWETLQDEVGAYGSPLFPSTYLVGTPSGGTHAYYRMPENLQGHLKNRVHANGVPVDVRAEGKGYVIGAGSQTMAGEYRVLDLPETQIPELSPQLVQWFETHGYVEGIEQADAPLPAMQSSQIVSHAPGFLPSLDEVMTQVSESRRGEPDMAPIPVGQRNQVLHDWAYGRFVHYPEDGERIVAETFDRGRRSGLPDTEIMTILGSIKRQLGGAQ